MDTSNFVRETDFDSFNGTLLTRLVQKDYVALEKDLDRVIRNKIAERMDRARDEWKEIRAMPTLELPVTGTTEENPVSVPETSLR